MIGNLLGQIIGSPQQQQNYPLGQEQRQRAQQQMHRDMQARMSDRFRLGLVDSASQPVRYNPPVKVIYKSKSTLWERLRKCFT